MYGRVRNYRCPCGSGLKFKNCCLPKILEDYTKEQGDSVFVKQEKKKEGKYWKKRYERIKNEK
jgi:hypothetical protein